MIAGYIDLSVGSAMSLCAVLFALLVREGVSFAPAVALTLLLGVGLGALNGLLVMRLRITPVIATLVTLSLFKGAALLVVPDGVSAIKGAPGHPMPPSINAYARSEVWLGLPAAFYAAVGVCAAAAGVARASYMSLGDPLSGDGMELDCIIAVLLGGTAFSGGEGSVAKTVIGALIIVCVTTGLMTVIPGEPGLPVPHFEWLVDPRVEAALWPGRSHDEVLEVKGIDAACVDLDYEVERGALRAERARWRSVYPALRDLNRSIRRGSDGPGSASRG